MKKIQLTSATLKDILDYVVPMFVRERALESLKKDDKIFRSGLYLWAGDERVFKQFQEADYDKIRKAWIEKLEPSRKNYSLARQFIGSLEFSDNEENSLTQYFDWTPARLEELPAPIAVVLYDMMSQSVTVGATNYPSYPTSHAILLLANTCNIVGEAHLPEFRLCTTHGCMTDDIVELCEKLDKAGLSFYTARLFVRRRILACKDPQSGIKDFSALQRRCVALLEFLAMLERDSA